MIGQTISHYKILEKLGEGGMGVVYKAEDTRLERMVALKFLPPHLAASEQDKARFIQEAKAASALNHPNVCTIHDIQDHDGQMFIVMEFVDGQTLRQKKDAISFKQAVEIGIQVADGLAAAHEKGIVHRDIKPENIMIRKDGIAQIMDFGLAKLRSSSSTINRLTKEGSTVGTAGYMSPEQVQGQDSDQRSDIFSLGVLLYELFTGQLPFKGVHETALAYEIVNVDAPPMSAVVPEMDPTLDAIVLECLEKDPNERMQSVKQVAIDLKKFKRESSRQRVSRVTAARPALRNADRPAPAPGKGRALWPAVAGLLALALLASGWMLWHRTVAPRFVARFALPLPKDQQVGIADHPAVAISPDGSRIVYAANGKIYQRRLESFSADPIPGTEDAVGPFFSPDGRWIGFFSGGRLKKVPVNGGAAVDLAAAETNRGGAWGPDGVIIFSPSGRGGLSRMKEDGGDLQRFTLIDTAQNERTHRWPSCLPDGKTVLFTLGLMGSPDYYEDATIVAVNLESGKRKVILKGASSAQYVSTGYLLFLHIGTLFAVPFDLGRLEITGTPFPVVENVSADVTTGAGQFAVSKNGTLAYLPGQGNLSDRMLAFIDLKGGVSTLPVAEHAYVDPRLSPDGRRIALGIQSGKDFDIWVYDIQRNSMSRLTFGGSNRSPVWSPDGRQIAYSNNTAGVNNTAGQGKVVIIQSDGGGAPQEIGMDYDRTYVNCWSHDGSSLIVTVPHQGMGWDLCVVPVTGDRKPWMFLSTKFDESFASLSPDGKWLAYLSNETGSPQVYVRPFPRGVGKWQISSEFSTRADWSPDGRTLYFGSAKGIMAMPITGTQTLTTGAPVILLKDYRGAALESGVTYDVSPDGKHILVTRPREGDGSPTQIDLVMNWFDEIEKTVAQGR
jgi:Tol biopolymer transport system component/predicted Ser/Thr protein kinase